MGRAEGPPRPTEVQNTPYLCSPSKMASLRFRFRYVHGREAGWCNCRRFNPKVLPSWVAIKPVGSLPSGSGRGLYTDSDFISSTPFHHWSEGRGVGCELIRAHPSLRSYRQLMVVEEGGVLFLSDIITDKLS